MTTLSPCPMYVAIFSGIQMPLIHRMDNLTGSFKVITYACKYDMVYCLLEWTIKMYLVGLYYESENVILWTIFRFVTSMSLERRLLAILFAVRHTQSSRTVPLGFCRWVVRSVTSWSVDFIFVGELSFWSGVRRFSCVGNEINILSILIKI